MSNTLSFVFYVTLTLRIGLVMIYNWKNSSEMQFFCLVYMFNDDDDSYLDYRIEIYIFDEMKRHHKM